MTRVRGRSDRAYAHLDLPYSPRTTLHIMGEYGTQTEGNCPNDLGAWARACVGACVWDAAAATEPQKPNSHASKIREAIAFTGSFCCEFIRMMVSRCALGRLAFAGHLRRGGGGSRPTPRNPPTPKLCNLPNPRTY